jgi:hypothetical protein
MVFEEEEVIVVTVIRTYIIIIINQLQYKKYFVNHAFLKPVNRTV